jgi:predicted MFS family arabinose efflux permease
LCASLIGIGLARFAYTPLLPALIGAAWFTPAEAAYLGAINLIGYLAGALLAQPLVARRSARSVLRAMMLLATIAFFACAFELGFVWFTVWRLGAGIAGGVIMVLAAPTILPHVPAGRRGLVSGVIFTGVGLGIAASGTLVPLLLGVGVIATWCGLGACAALLTALAWHGWPAGDAWSRPIHGARVAARVASPAIRALLLAYGLTAAGLVPHMVFLVDFIARGLNQGVAVGARAWIAFGIGAMAGPLLLGRLADRIGFGLALRLVFAAGAVAVALPLAATDAVALTVSSLIAGACTPGAVPLAFGRAQELTRDPEETRRVWRAATTSYALFQAAGAALCAELFARTGSHVPLFAVGAAALVLAFFIDVGVARAQTRRARA